MLSEVLENEGRVSEKHQIRLGKVPLAQIDLALASDKLTGMRGLRWVRRRANLMMDSLGGARPVLEGNARVPVELFGLVGQLPCAHGPAAHAQIRDVHLGISAQQHRL